MNLGKYQLVRKLATGGMAEVFLAKTRGAMGFEKQLVVKRILPHYAEDPRFIEMFLAEATLAAQLSHPNVVQIFDFGEEEGTYFIAMEYVEGHSLRTVLEVSAALGRGIPLLYAVKLISLACDGLAYVHDFQDPVTHRPLGLVHRDINPDNLMLTLTGGLKLVDFGIAKASAGPQTTQAGLVKGKLGYMPPEQLRGEALDRRVDLYALGVTLYELLSGAPAFDGGTDALILEKILHAPLPRLGDARPDVPEALQRIVERLMSRAPAERYPSCVELQRDLERFLHAQGEPLSASQLAAFAAQLPAAAAQEEPPARNGGPEAPIPLVHVLRSGPPTQKRPPAARTRPLATGHGGVGAINPSGGGPYGAAMTDGPEEGWLVEGYGLDTSGDLHGQVKVPPPVAPTPWHEPEVPLEFARSLERPVTDADFGPPPGRKKRTRARSLAVWGLFLLVLGAGSAAGYKLLKPELFPAPPASTKLPELFIDSNPPGAAIYIDGTLKGTTPWVTQNLYPAGRPIPVRLVLPGFEAWTGAMHGGVREHLAPKLRLLKE